MVVADSPLSLVPRSPYELAPETPLLFRGLDGTEAEEFIFAIRQRAFAAGKARDLDWQLDLATSSLTGGALRWYEGLDDVKKHDWELFKQALLDRYPIPQSDSRSVFACARTKRAL